MQGRIPLHEAACGLVRLGAGVEPDGGVEVEVGDGAPHPAQEVDAHLPPAREAQADVRPCLGLGLRSGVGGGVGRLVGVRVRFGLGHP